MAKGMYVGVNGVAKKVKKIYVGSGDKAKKVKKGYIGVGGVARPFFSSAEIPMYYGFISNASYAAFNRVGISLRDMALFVGGYSSTNSYGDGVTSGIDIYDKQLTHTTTTLPVSRADMAGCSLIEKDFAIVAGGRTRSYTSNNVSKDVYKINNLLIKELASSGLSIAVYGAAAARTDRYAIIAGGHTSSSSGVTTTVCAYNTSLTQTILSDDLSFGGYYLSGVSLNNLAFFAGGSYTSRVNAYNDSLTRLLSATGSSIPDYRKMGVATLSDRAIFAGGANVNNDGKTSVYTVDSSLTVNIVPPGLTKGRCPSGVSFEGFAVFGGGYYGTTLSNWVCDIYDENMTVTNPTDDMGRQYAYSNKTNVDSAARVGNYAVFTDLEVTRTRAFVQN